MYNVEFTIWRWEFWHTKILTNIVKGIGCLLKIDNATLRGEFGHGRF